MAYLINPSKEAISKGFPAPGHDSNCTSYCCYTIGPGGRSNNYENNEKGMLDSIPLFLARNVEDDSHEGGFNMRAEHDKHYEGVYAETHYVSRDWPEIGTAGGEGVYDSGGI